MIGTKLLAGLLLRTRMIEKPSQATELKPLEPRAEMTPIQVVAVEAGIAVAYLFSILKLLRGGHKWPGIFCLISVIVIGKKLTGCGMDAANVLARSVVCGEASRLPQYLAGAAVGSVLGGVFVKSLEHK